MYRTSFRDLPDSCGKTAVFAGNVYTSCRKASMARFIGKNALLNSPTTPSFSSGSWTFFRLPPANTPATKPPWSFAASFFDFGKRAYSSADSDVRIVTLKRSFNASNRIVLFDHCFALRLFPWTAAGVQAEAVLNTPWHRRKLSE